MHRALAAAVAAAAVACGGGSDAGSGGSAGGLEPPSRYAARCATPRSGIDPTTGSAYPDVQGTSADEKSWLRAWTDDLYLWYREVPAADPSRFATPIDYFAVLKTTASTPSGRPKDRFHFAIPTAQWQALAQSGVAVGYGALWAVLAPTPPRQVVVAYAEPGSPAAAANVRRGAQVLAADGVDIVQANDQASIDRVNAALGPSTANETHTFTLLDHGASSPRDVVLVSANVHSAPVQNVATVPTATGMVGYMLFNDHLATAEAALISAIQQLEGAGISDLVLDMRYNGGGYLVVASELAYMVAGPAQTAGRAFEKPLYNDKHATTDPLTAEPIVPMPFLDATVGLSVPAGQPLPHLDLRRVFVLTGSGTCSASESLLNGLRGVGVEVIQIGAATCGKPYAFLPQDNCGTTYFSILFQGVNDRGFGDYADGFTPGASGPAASPGCAVADDFTRALGDPAEARLAAALAYRARGSCPAAVALERGAALRASTAEGALIRPPWRESRIVRW